MRDGKRFAVRNDTESLNMDMLPLKFKMGVKKKDDLDIWDCLPFGLSGIMKSSTSDCTAGAWGPPSTELAEEDNSEIEMEEVEPSIAHVADEVHRAAEGVEVPSVNKVGICGFDHAATARAT